METVRASHGEGTGVQRTMWERSGLGRQLTELFDNARRAGATMITITTRRVADHTEVAVRDDGSGFANPAAALAYGVSAWDGRGGIHAPVSGKGLYALSASPSASIASGTRNGTGWRVELTPAHFRGDAEAEVRRTANDQVRPGAMITFDAGDAAPEQVEHVVAVTARHMPIVVRLNGRVMPRAAFLPNPIGSVERGGFRIGVYAEHDERTPDVNLHGRVVSGPLPKVQIGREGWSARAEARGEIDGIELEPALRDSLRNNEAARRLREHAERAVYEVLAQIGATARAPTAAHERAAQLGVRRPDNDPWLKPWRAAGGDARQRGRSVPHDALIVALEGDMPERDAQALGDAAAHAGMHDRLFAPDKAFAGQEWYDRLPVIKRIDTIVTEDGERTNATNHVVDRLGPPGRVVDRIELIATCRTGTGEPATRSIPARYGLAGGPDAYWIEDSLVLIARNGHAGIESLTDLLTAAYFHVDEESRRSDEEQRRDFRMKAEYRAARLLDDRDAADRRQIARAIENELLHRIERAPDDGERITARIEGRRVSVSFDRI